MEKEIIDNNLYEFLVPRVRPRAVVEFDDFCWYYSEMLDDLSTFYEVTKYPVLKVVKSLLEDLSNQYFEISKNTAALFKQWKIKKEKEIENKKEK